MEMREAMQEKVSESPSGTRGVFWTLDASWVLISHISFTLQEDQKTMKAKMREKVSRCTRILDMAGFFTLASNQGAKMSQQCTIVMSVFLHSSSSSSSFFFFFFFPFLSFPFLSFLNWFVSVNLLFIHSIFRCDPRWERLTLIIRSYTMLSLSKSSPKCVCYHVPCSVLWRQRDPLCCDIRKRSTMLWRQIDTPCCDVRERDRPCCDVRLFSILCTVVTPNAVIHWVRLFMFMFIYRWQTKPKMTIHGDLYYEVRLNSPRQ